MRRHKNTPLYVDFEILSGQNNCGKLLMSDLREMKAYVAGAATEHGHDLGRWHWIGTRERPMHSASCRVCGRVIHLIWDREQYAWDVQGAGMLAYDCEPVGRRTYLAGVLGHRRFRA